MRTHVEFTTLRRPIPIARLVLVAVAALIAAGALLAQAQEDAPPTLVVDQPITDELTETTIARVYPFTGTAGDVINLTATTENGLSVAVLLTDAQGATLAQTRSSTSPGETALTDIVLPATGLYYVTVLPAIVADAPATGTFTLTLSLAQTATTATAEATPEATAEATLENLGEQLQTTSGIQATLTWSASADMNLEVRDPIGGFVFFNNPTTTSGGSFTSPNVNGGCTALVVENATEAVSWAPGGVPIGSYEVLVYHEQVCDSSGPVNFTINVTVDGQALTPVEGVLLPEQVFIASFVVNADGTATMRQSNGIKGEAQLPASSAVIISAAQPIQLGENVTGTLENDAPFDSYTFSAEANEIVTINMNSTSGSLDTYLALLDPVGNVVYFNDDAAEGVTNSLLQNAVLATPGSYTIVATRYGLDIGGTEGGYELSLGGVVDLTTTPEVGTQTAVTPAVTDSAAAETTAAATSELPADVVALQLPEGTIEITLVWNTGADLQLLVRDPAGDSVFDDQRTIRSGGRLGATGNINCQQSVTTPVYYVYWPTNITPRAGAYEIDVWFQNECNDPSPVSFTLYATVNGEQVLATSLPAGQPFLPNERFITSFTIDQSGNATAGLGGITGLNTLEWEAEAADAQTIISGTPVNGSITAENKFDLYSFEGLSGDTVTIDMRAAADTNLDTKLYLIGPNGQVATLNDDAVAGENTNSLISNFVLPEDGEYIIIATHYGELYGVSSGPYTLTLEQAT